jgi:FixJ family two-component response regulator
MQPGEPSSAEQASTVFIVDDDPGIVKLLERLLRAEGMRTESFPDADSFLGEYLKRDENEAECLLLDLKLPDVSGLELQRRLAEIANALPVVMITGHGSASSAVEAMKLGAVDFIEKPFHMENVLEVVKNALERDRKAKRERDDASRSRERFARLTPREQEVLNLVVAGHSSREVAEILKLSKKTIDLHRSHIMAKVRADSVVDLVTMVLTGRPSRLPEAEGRAFKASDPPSSSRETDQ